jgi:hypothetical protein
MRAKPVVSSMVALLLCSGGMTHADSAQETFAKGEKLLAKADFAGALDAFSAAARADRSNQEYSQHYSMVRSVVDLRNRLEAEKNAERWQYISRALRAFYADERIFPELLAIDQKIHARLNSTVSAVMLAETQLSMEQNAEAVQTLSSVAENASDPVAQALLGIALARTGKKAEAKKIAAALTLPNDSTPGVMYTAARLQAAAGASAQALKLLISCFESLPPSRQEGYREHAKSCPEFAAMAAADEFAAALSTASKVSESKCSGGSSCAGCPMKGSCPKSQGQQAK